MSVVTDFTDSGRFHKTESRASYIRCTSYSFGCVKNLSHFSGREPDRFSSSRLLEKWGEQRFHRQIAPLAPLRAGDVPQSCRDQHQCRVAVGKCADHSCSPANLTDDPLERIVRAHLATSGEPPFKLTFSPFI